MPLLFPAVRETLKKGYSHQDFRKDLIAGLVVGVVALPLGMALAIATGVAPQFGLVTVVIAGLIAALVGGSRFNISGPTAAFVVVLLPIVERYGFGGLLIAGALAGLMLIALGLFRFGKYIHLIPYPVVVGFTSGIGVVIATLQLRDFFGLTLAGSADNTLEKLLALVQSLPTTQISSLMVGSLTLALMILWPRLKTPIPPHLPALLIGTGVALFLPSVFPSFHAETLGDRFQYVLADGTIGRGIPPVPPHFEWPWNLPGPDGKPLVLSWGLINQLLGPAFAIAMLGALESLLCAVVADRMTGRHHHPNGELIGQGLANFVAPFFGGIPATAAIARTATNVHAGARSPFASVIHALAVLLAMVSLAPLFSYVPMAVLAGLLLMTAWKMSEVHHFQRILRAASANDRFVLLACFSLTIIFDMVIAVTVGLGLAALLFLRNIAKSAEAHELFKSDLHGIEPPAGIHVFDMNGSLFFGAAQQMLETIRKRIKNNEIVILDLRDVRHLDFSGVIALETAMEEWRKRGVRIVFSRIQPEVRLGFEKAGMKPEAGELAFASNIEEAIASARVMLAGLQLDEEWLLNQDF